MLMCRDWKAAICRLDAIVLVLALCLVTVAQAAEVVQVVGSLPYGASYIPNGWLPVRVQVRNDSDKEIDGSVRIAPTAPGIPEFRASVRSAPHSRVTKTLWSYFPESKQTLLARVTFNDATGALVARTELTGAPSGTENQWFANGMLDRGFLVSVAGEEMFLTDYEAVDDLGQSLANAFDMHATVVQVDPVSAPAAWVPYKNAIAVQLRSLDPDDLSTASRNAILDYVKAGGVLLISAPDVRQVGGSWLEPLLPVRLIGNREMNQVGAPGDQPLAFPVYLKCTEAIEGNGKVLLRDKQFVYAAYRNLGLGRIVFTSFPASAFPVGDLRAASLWSQLIGLDRYPVGVAGSSLRTSYPVAMELMLGRKAASWKMAATAVGLLVLLVVLTHVIWRGASRPFAFKLSLAASVVIAAGFSLMAGLRQEAEPLQEAKLAIVDASPEGTLTQEYSAVSGSQQAISRTVADPTAILASTLVRQDRPVLNEWPASLQRIDVNPQRVDLVSLATGLQRDLHASAQGRFGPQGLELNIENALGARLASTQLGWGVSRLSLPAIEPGSTKAVVNGNDVRPVDEYTSASGVASQDEQHKAAILKDVMNLGANPRFRGVWPTVYGWASEWPAVAAMDGIKPDRVGSQTLVRIPLQLQPSSGAVRIDGVFNQLNVSEAKGLPYDPSRHEFIRTTLGGDWLIAIEYPREVGLLKPSKARLVVDLSTAQHKVEVRVGQCPGGRTPKGRGSAQGRLVVEWNGAVGVQSAEFTCTPEDFDSAGRVWLRFSIQQSGQAGAMGVEPRWQFGSLDVDLEGDVVAAPAGITAGK